MIDLIIGTAVLIGLIILSVYVTAKCPHRKTCANYNANNYSCSQIQDYDERCYRAK